MKQCGEEATASNGYIYYISKDKDTDPNGHGYTATDPKTGLMLKHESTKKKLVEFMNNQDLLQKIDHCQTTNFYKEKVKTFKELLKEQKQTATSKEEKRIKTWKK